MKRFLIPAVCALLFEACDNPQPAKSSHGAGFHPPAEAPIVANPDLQPQEVPPAPHSTEPKVETQPKPSRPVPDPPVTEGKLLYGKPVPGKQGFVSSPYGDSQGYIDVRGFPPGTEVKDPYTGKNFLVP